MADHCDINALKDVYKKKPAKAKKLYDEVSKIMDEARKKGEDPLEYYKQKVSDKLAEKTEEINRSLTTFIREQELEKDMTDVMDEIVAEAEKAGKPLNENQIAKYKSRLALSLLETDPSGVNLNRASVNAVKDDLKNRAMAIVYDGAEKIDDGMGMIDLRQGKYDREMFRIVYGAADGKFNDVAKDLYMKAIKPATDFLHAQKIAAGYNAKYRADYFLVQNHSYDGMLSLGKLGWKDLARKSFDFERMGLKDKNEIELYLNTFYDELTMAREYNLEVDLEEKRLMKDEGARFEKARSVRFKDGDAAYEYNKLVNKKTVFETLAGQVNSETSKIAAARTFGPDYEKGFANFMHHIKVPLDERFRGMKVASVFRGIVDGGWATGRSTAARAASNWRKFVDMGSLNTAVITTLTDYVIAPILVSNMFGKGALYQGCKIIASQAKLIKNPKLRREWAKRMHYLVEESIGGTSSATRFSGGEADLANDSLFARAHKNFMKFTGLQQQSEIMRGAIGMATSMNMGELAGRAFKDCPEGFRTMLKAVGINEDDWAKLSKGVEEFDGMKMITHEGLRSNAGLNPAEVDVLGAKLTAYFKTVAEKGSPTATEVHTFWKGQYDPDSVAGIFIPCIMQYKSFALATWDSFKLINHLSGGGISGAAQVAKTVAGMTAMGGAVVMLKDLASGKPLEEVARPFRYDESEEATKLNWDFVTRAFLQGGAGGLAFDYMMPDRNKFGSSLGGDIMGPSVSKLGKLSSVAIHTPAKAFQAATEGDTEELRKVANDALTTSIRNLPSLPIFGNLLRKYLIELSDIYVGGKEE